MSLNVLVNWIKSQFFKKNQYSTGESVKLH